MAALTIAGIIGAALAAIGGVVGIALSVGTVIANLITQLPKWVSYSFFTFLIGMDAFVVGGLVGGNTITGLFLFPINIVLGTDFGAWHLFIPLVIMGFIFALLWFLNIIKGFQH